MNTSLLSCVRGAGERLRPALLEEKHRRPLRFRFLQPFRVFGSLTFMPLVWPGNEVFFLSNYPRANSKTAAVLNELVDAGVPKSSFLYPPEAGNAPWARIVRLLLRLPWALIFLLTLKRRVRRLDDVDLAIVLGRESFRRTLNKARRVMPVIISDVSPTLHMLWSAAAAEGNRAIWWQDDFHHHWRLPYGIRGAAVLNDPGLAAAHAIGTAQVIARRPTVESIGLRNVPENPRVGVTTNARFGQDVRQIHRLAEIAARLGADTLYLRLHPNSALDAADFHNLPIELAPKGEPMHRFASRVDVAVSGNSAAQLWLLRYGVPIVHVAGLDPQGYDLYGYVERGFAYGARDVSELSVAALRSFYSNPHVKSELVRSYTSIVDAENVPELSALGRLLQGPGQSIQVNCGP